MIRLQVEREKAGKTRQTLAAAASISPPRYGGMELGRIVPPPRSVELRRLAEALGWVQDPAALLLEVDPLEDAAHYLLGAEGHASH